MMAQIADLKRSKSISEKDYKSDSRFENMMKVLESDIVAKAEPLVLIKGLKVEKRLKCSMRVVMVCILAGSGRAQY